MIQNEENPNTNKEHKLETQGHGWCQGLKGSGFREPRQSVFQDVLSVSGVLVPADLIWPRWVWMEPSC